MEGMEGLKGRRILVTGGTGFIGSHLVEKLLNHGSTVIVPYIEIDPRSIFALHNLAKKAVLRALDIRDKKKTFELIKKGRIDYIFHLAAQTIVTEAYDNPLTTLETNIMGTLHILEAVRVSPYVKGIIVASSDKAYGKTSRAYKEFFPLKGDHPYDVSKASADLISQMYFKTYKTPVVITRFGNVYGEGDYHFDRIIPGVCEAIIKKKTLLIRSDGKYIRDYIYVTDVIDGYLTLLKHIDNIHGEAYNFSSDDALSVIALVRKAEKVLEVKIPYEILNIVKNEIPYQHLDDSKIRRFGWSPKFDLTHALRRTFLWYKNVIKDKTH